MRNRKASASATEWLEAALASPLGAVVVSCLAYSLFSIMMTITNKELLGSQAVLGYFPFPVGLVFVQNFSSFVFLRVASFQNMITLQPVRLERLRHWIPLNLVFIAMVTTGTLGLSLLTVPMVTIFKNLQTACTSYGDWYFFGKTVSWGTIFCLAMMISGAFVAGYHDLEFNLHGYIWVILNCCSGSAYILTTKLVMDSFRMEKIDNINYNCIISLPFLLLVMLFNGELFAMYHWLGQASVSLYFGFVMIVNAIFSFGISFTSYWVIQTTSPTTFGILGSVNKIPLTLFSIWWFQNVFSTIGLYAITASLIGGIVYAMSSAYSQSQSAATIRKNA